MGVPEETKMNFFEPSAADNVEAAIGMESEHVQENIMETAVDPLEWKQELDRVYKDLVNIEKEIEVAKREGGNYACPDYEEYRRHLDLVLEMCNDIKDSSVHEVRQVFATAGEELET